MFMTLFKVIGSIESFAAKGKTRELLSRRNNEKWEEVVQREGDYIFFMKLKAIFMVVISRSAPWIWHSMDLHIKQRMRMYITLIVLVFPVCYRSVGDKSNQVKEEQENINRKVKDVFLLNERVFSIWDAWPLRKKYTKFVLYMSYLSVHMVIMYIDLIEAFGNLESMVGNIIDNTIATATYFILFLLRFNKLIEHGIVTVREEIAKSKFETVEEMRLYFAYHNISDKFGRYAISTTLVIATLWYLSPMLQLLKLDSGQSNESSKAYKLPFRAYAFLDYQDDFQNFIIMYLYQFPLMFIALSHISAISLLVNLVLHICGKFSILSYRIQNIATNSNVNLDSVIKEFVTAHVKLITTANSINSALQVFLLVELLQTTIRMATIIYMMLLNPSGSFVSTLTYGLYISIIISMLYLYSFIGEQLSNESMKVSEAFYATDWNNLSLHNQKLLLLVMSLGRQTLHVTAGKFYTFSLYGFIDVMKTSFGYVSLLRTLI